MAERAIQAGRVASRWRDRPWLTTICAILVTGHLVALHVFAGGPAAAQGTPAPFTTEITRKAAPPATVPAAVARSPWADIAPLLPVPSDKSEAVQLRQIAVRGDRRRTDIVLVLTRRTALSIFVVANPLRLIVDGANLDVEGAAEAPSAAKTLVADFRFGALEPGTGRLMFDCTQPVKIAAIAGRRVEGGQEVTITIVPAGRSDVALLPPVTWGAGTDEPPVLPAAPTASSSASLPLLMIDPGHGGIDPGAVTGPFVLEKDVVLAVAHRLKSLLDARGKVRVIMTRHGDETIALDKRIAVTRAAKADLFVSLHADTFGGDAAAVVRGGSVYVLGAKATNAVAQALAEKENAADQRAGIAGANTVTDAAVEGILADLTARETQTLSQSFQATLVRQLRKSMLLAREPARAAAFRVLRQAETPAVLVELGYMSNGQDIALLQSDEWQTAVASRIADAVEAYFARPRGFALDR